MTMNFNESTPSSQPSLFAQIINQQTTIKEKNSDNDFEQSINKGDGFFKLANHISEIKDEAQNEELSRNQMERERNLENRRRLNNNIKLNYGKSLKESITIDKNTYESAQVFNPQVSELDTYIKNLASENQLEQYYGLVCIRKLITLPEDPLIQEVIDKSVVFALVNTLDHKLPEFVFEAVTCICAITSGSSDQIKSIVSKGAHKKLVPLCDSPLFEIQEQAIWGLGNLASEHHVLRDQLISEGALNKLLFYMKTSERKSLVKNCLWTFSNFCKGKNPPGYDILSPVSSSIIFYNNLVFRLYIAKSY